MAIAMARATAMVIAMARAIAMAIAMARATASVRFEWEAPSRHGCDGWLARGRALSSFGIMTTTATTPRMSPAEYLAWEREQATKHEFYRGEVFAMAGGSMRHNFLAVAASAELRAALAAKGCHVMSSDQKIAAPANERYVYADAVAVCRRVERAGEDSDVLLNPSVVVEVLSPSTEAYDRGGKWECYQRLASLTDYLLVSQAGPRIEHFARDADGSWRYRVLEAGDVITLADGATLAVDAIYRGAFELPAA